MDTQERVWLYYRALLTCLCVRKSHLPSTRLAFYGQNVFHNPTLYTVWDYSFVGLGCLFAICLNSQQQQKWFFQATTHSFVQFTPLRLSGFS